MKKMGLPPGTAAAAADSFVWMAEQDELAVERVLMHADEVAGWRWYACKGSG